MKLIFERSVPGRRCSILPGCDVPVVELEELGRKQALHLPEVSEMTSAATTRSWQRRPTESMTELIHWAPVR